MGMISAVVERLRQFKQRFPRTMKMPGVGKLNFRDVDRCIIDEVFAGRAYGDPTEIEAGDVVVDAGGHIGVFALWSAVRVGPSGRVLVFEPAPENLKLLRRNVDDNGLTQTKVFDCALSDKNGEARLFLAPRHGNPAANTLKGAADQETLSIKTRRLDDVVLEEKVPRVDLLKIDVEGAELQVLAGAERTLRLTMRIVMELHPEKIDPMSALAVITAAGFSAKVVSKTDHSWLVDARRV